MVPDFHFTWPYGHQDSLDEGIARITAMVGPGWTDILKRLIADLIALGWDGEIHQVKEKFGGLRFYIGAGSDEVWKRIGEAEVEAMRVCEACGKPGRIRGMGWLACRCDECWDKEQR